MAKQKLLMFIQERVDCINGLRKMEKKLQQRLQELEIKLGKPVRLWIIDEHR